MPQSATKLLPANVVAPGLLTGDDFTFLGSYPFSADNQAAYGMGLTCRRVNGQLRFLTFDYSGAASSPGHADARLIEFALPATLGGSITTKLTTWLDIFSPLSIPNVGGGDEYGLWWEDQGNGNDGVGRLWTTHCADYPGDPNPAGSNTGTNQPLALATRTLNADGTIANLQGQWGFTGIGQRAIHGGIQPIPQWFRDQYGITQNYLCGWGGYTSRMAQGLGPSLGLMAVAFPEPTTYAANTIIPTTDFRILTDHRSGTTQSDYNPIIGDRGRRNYSVTNYYDGGDTRPNPTTSPTFPPVSGARWLSPSPDGFGRFVWGDSFYQTGCWIEGASKRGFVAVASLSTGRAYYMTSTLHCDSRDAELQIFDPNDFGKVLQGVIHPWQVQPADTKLLTPDLKPLGFLYGHAGNSPAGAVAGACFDAPTKTLYLWLTQKNSGYGCVLAAYRVNC